MTVVLAISSAILAWNGAIDPAPRGGVGESFALEAIEGALEAGPSQDQLQNDLFLDCVRLIFPMISARTESGHSS